CERVARQAVNFSAGERVAGAVGAADDQRLAVRKHRGGVIRSRGVKIRRKRPYAGRLRRYWKRHHEDDEQRLQDNSANAARGFAGTLISRFHIFPSRFRSIPKRRLAQSPNSLAESLRPCARSPIRLRQLTQGYHKASAIDI